MERFKKILVVDTEYRHLPGHRVEPVALTARDLISGEVFQFKADEVVVGTCPLPLGQDVLYVTYFAPAEASFWQAKAMPKPKNVIDLYVEHKLLDNNNMKSNKVKNSLLSVLIRRGLRAMNTAEKTEMRDLILGSKTYGQDQWQKIMAYNLEDVEATARLFEDMRSLGQLDVDRALIRGSYSWQAGVIEDYGVPVDVETLERLRKNWNNIELSLIREVDKTFGVYDGRTFKRDLFQQYLITTGTPWRYDDMGKPILDDDTFKQMAALVPKIGALRELRKTLGQLRIHTFPVGADGRTRTGVRPFSSMTGRNQPKTSEFIFGSAKWLRSLIKPGKGRAIAVIDQSQQEFGIAAALSGDENMQEAYSSGDPYLRFGQQAGAIPANATKESHESIRDLYKAAVLATQYGMGAQSLGERINKPEYVAQALLDQHRATYRKFWAWQEKVLNHARVAGLLYTAFGWEVEVDPIFNPRSMGNFLMQANGAEILRIAAILAEEAGIKIGALIHDAVLIEAAAEMIDEHTRLMQDILAQASRIVLDGFPLRSDARVVKYPDRFFEKKAVAMWDLMMRILNEVEDEQ